MVNGGALVWDAIVSASSEAYGKLFLPVRAPGNWPQNFSKGLVMREKMSTGTGNTTVVFFSTPISVRVCR